MPWSGFARHVTFERAGDLDFACQSITVSRVAVANFSGRPRHFAVRRNPTQQNQHARFEAGASDHAAGWLPAAQGPRSL